MKNYIIKQEGDDWVLYDHTGKKVLGRHKSKESALAQERAIQARKGAFEALDIVHDDLMLVHAFENDLQTIKDVDIFAVGTWRGVNSPPEGDKYTEKDLDAMIEAFQQGIMEPNIKITHGDDNQQVDIGKIANLKRVGKKLFADFVGVPKALYELMKKGLFKTRSSEVAWNLKHDGKTWPRVLKAVALLAPGQKPAVGGLSEGYQFEAVYCYEVPQKKEYQGNISAIIAKWGSWAGSFDKCVSTISGKPGISDAKSLCAWIHKRAEGKWPAQHQASEDYEPDTDELRSVEIAAGTILSYQELQKQEERRKQDMALEELLKRYNCKDEAELEVILSNSKEAEKRLKEYEADQEKAKKTQLKAFVEQAKKEGKLLPKEEDGIMKTFESLLAKKDEAGIDILKSYISTGPVRVDLEEKSRKDDDSKTHDESKRPRVEVDRLAKEYMANGKAKDYQAALVVVRTNHKELWDKYNASK